MRRPLLLAAAKIGDPAPTFTATASDGKTYKLADYRGKYVVLEWHNNGCPYVGKQYDSGNMQKLQKQWTSKGVVWFTILSSAPGKQGFVTASDENAYIAKMQAAPTAALLDPSGEIGHLYDAKTSPQMVVIDPTGRRNLRRRNRQQTHHRSRGRPRRNKLRLARPRAIHGR